MFIRIISLIILSFSLAACNKPDPNPELKDPIYSDISSMLSAVSQSIEAEKKALEGFEKELADVVPQTGQIKYAQKRVTESKQRLVRLEQEKKYLELKREARKKSAKKSHLAAYKNGEPWPDPREWEAYKLEKQFREASRTWDVKKRMEDLGFKESLGPGEPSGGH